MPSISTKSLVKYSYSSNSKSSSSSSNILPVSSINEYLIISETASNTPEPHIPQGGWFPIVSIFSSLDKSILLIAPNIPPTPCFILAPSKAGPAAVEQVITSSLLPIAISPLVPKSNNNEYFSDSNIPEDNIPAVISLPT